MIKSLQISFVKTQGMNLHPFFHIDSKHTRQVLLCFTLLDDCPWILIHGYEYCVQSPEEEGGLEKCHFFVMTLYCIDLEDQYIFVLYYGELLN